MDWENIVTLAVTPLLALATVLLKDILQGKREKGAKEIERDAALETKRLDELGAVRQELREQVAELKKDSAELSKQLRQLSEENERFRIHNADYQIALLRYAARIEECAEFIQELLEAEERLSAGQVRKAEALLKLIENDRQMSKQLHLNDDEKPELVG